MIPIALASDTLSIATMEVVDNAIILAIPGAMEAGLDSLLFWGSLAFALVAAGAVALPVDRWLSPAARATPPSTKPASTAARRSIRRSSPRSRARRGAMLEAAGALRMPRRRWRR